jgi:Family of unknown function (DUF6325)
MVLGPMELIVLCFPAAQLNDGVQATLDRLDSVADMRAVDILVVRTDDAGGACAVELSELPGLRVDPAAVARLATGLITETDIDDIADLVDHGTDAVAVLVEHVWVQDLADDMVAVDGTVLALMHVPAVQALTVRPVATPARL